jgi:acetoin utilization protein AcuB
MALVQAITGVAGTYPVKPLTPEAPLIDAVDSQTGKDHRNPAGDQTKLAAQQAYQEQTKRTRTPKPAILARDLMPTPVVTLPSDATLTPRISRNRLCASRESIRRNNAISP